MYVLKIILLLFNPELNAADSVFSLDFRPVGLRKIFEVAEDRFRLVPFGKTGESPL